MIKDGQKIDLFLWMCQIIDSMRVLGRSDFQHLIAS